MFGKSEFRDEERKIVPLQIEKEVHRSFVLDKKRNLKICPYKLTNLLCSDAIKIVEYFESGERRELYEVEMSSELSFGRGRFGKDKINYSLEIYLKNDLEIYLKNHN